MIKNNFWAKMQACSWVLIYLVRKNFCSSRASDRLDLETRTERGGLEVIYLWKSKLEYMHMLSNYQSFGYIIE